MGEAKEKYEWLKRLDAAFDLLNGVMGTGASTMEEVDLPALLEQVPDYHRSLVPKVQPGLLPAVLKPKNRQGYFTNIIAMKQWMTDLVQKLDTDEHVVYNYFVMTPEIFWGMDLANICYEFIPFYLSAIFTDGVEREKGINS